MIKITKLPEPAGLIQYKGDKQPQDRQSYDKDSLSFKDYSICTGELSEDCYSTNEKESAFTELRKQLLKEQKYVCCYCGKAIPYLFNEHGSPQMKTEHFEPKSIETALQLEYKNLLASCLGNSEPNNKAKKHCDSSKGKEKLNHIKNPASPEFSPVFDYEVFHQLKRVEVIPIKTHIEKKGIKNDIGKNYLNLNVDSLCERRYVYFKVEVTKELGIDEDKWLKNEVQTLLQKYEDKCNDEKLPAFYDMITTYLQEWLQKHT